MSTTPQDWFAVNAPKVQTQPAGDWFSTNAPAAQPPKPGVVGRLAESYGIPTSGEQAAGMLTDAQQHPEELLTPGGVASHLLRGYGNQLEQVKKEYIGQLNEIADRLGSKQIDKTEATKQMMNAVMIHAIKTVPLFGQTLFNYGKDIEEGNYAGAAGGALGLASQVAGPKALSEARPYLGEGVARTGGVLTRNAEPIGNTVGYGGAAITAGEELLHGRPVSAGATALLSPLAANRAIRLTRAAGGGLLDLGNKIGRTPRPIEGPALPPGDLNTIARPTPFEGAEIPKEQTAGETSMEGFYGKSPQKSLLKAHERQQASPTFSTAPGQKPATPMLVPKADMTPEDLRFQDENMADILQATIGQLRRAAGQ